MASFDDWSDEQESDVSGHSLRLLTIREHHEQVAHDKTVAVVPGHYARAADVADILEKLGKDAAANHLRTKLPPKQNLRSGDLGEIFACEFISEKTEFEAPIKKLWWRDNRNWAMKGDDAIGICPAQDQNPTRFLKVEAKSKKEMDEDTISKARTALDGDNGLPSPHALSFVADRLMEIGEEDLSNEIRRVQLVEGVRSAQVQHMLFTYSGNDTEAVLRADLEDYSGIIAQFSVGLVMPQHQEFIRAIYKAIGGDDES